MGRARRRRREPARHPPPAGGHRLHRLGWWPVFNLADVAIVAAWSSLLPPIGARCGRCCFTGRLGGLELSGHAVRRVGVRHPWGRRGARVRIGCVPCVDGAVRLLGIALIGARLLLWRPLVHLSERPSPDLGTRPGGAAQYGGLLLAVPARGRCSVSSVCRSAPSGMSVPHDPGRHDLHALGCLLNGCCAGRPVRLSVSTCRTIVVSGAAGCPHKSSKARSPAVLLAPRWCLAPAAVRGRCSSLGGLLRDGRWPSSRPVSAAGAKRCSRPSTASRSSSWRRVHRLPVLWPS